MATCKYNVREDRFMRKCGDEATQAIVFSTELDDGFVVTTQLPLCLKHFRDKQEDLRYFGQEYKCLNLRS